MAEYDAFYKRLIAVAPMKNVTSRFAMERMKYTTAYPLHPRAFHAQQVLTQRWSCHPRRASTRQRRCEGVRSDSVQKIQLLELAAAYQVGFLPRWAYDHLEGHMSDR